MIFPDNRTDDTRQPIINCHLDCINSNCQKSPEEGKVFSGQLNHSRYLQRGQNLIWVLKDNSDYRFRGGGHFTGKNSCKKAK